jgi:hypothetical protein
MHRSAICAGLLLLGTAFSSFAQSKGQCSRPELANQKQDSDTINRLERAWTHAFLTGDTDFEQCLLLPDYSEIKSSGKVGNLSDELANAAKNKGKNPPMPESHPPTVLIHDDVAVAYGTFHFKDATGKEREMHSADYYHWENGGWRVFFAQQTAVPLS